jgi:hypothetical protein
VYYHPRLRARFFVWFAGSAVYAGVCVVRTVDLAFAEFLAFGNAYFIAS